jgi:hypothetical protein
MRDRRSPSITFSSSVDILVAVARVDAVTGLCSHSRTFFGSLWSVTKALELPSEWCVPKKDFYSYGPTWAFGGEVGSERSYNSLRRAALSC